MDRADREQELREPNIRTIMCPYCHGYDTEPLYGNVWVCFPCQTSFTLAQSVMAEDDDIPFLVTKPSNSNRFVTWNIIPFKGE